MTANTNISNAENTDQVNQALIANDRPQLISIKLHDRANQLGFDFPQEYLARMPAQEGNQERYFMFFTKGIAVPLVDFSENFPSLLVMSEKINQAYSEFENSMAWDGVPASDTDRAHKVKGFLAVQAADWYRDLYPAETSITIETDEIGRWFFEKLLENFNFDSGADSTLVAPLIALYKKESSIDAYSWEQAVQTGQQLIDAIYLAQGGQILNFELKKSLRHIIKTTLTQTYRNPDLDMEKHVYVGKFIVKRFVPFNLTYPTVAAILKNIYENYEALKGDLRQQGVSDGTISKNAVKFFMEAQVKIWLRVTAPTVHYRRLSVESQWNGQCAWFTQQILPNLVNSSEQEIIDKLLELIEKNGQYQNHSVREALIEVRSLTEQMQFQRGLGDELYGHFIMMLIEKILGNYKQSELDDFVSEIEAMAMELEDGSEFNEMNSEIKFVVPEIKGVSSKISPIPEEI